MQEKFRIGKVEERWWRAVALTPHILGKRDQHGEQVTS